MDSSLPPELTDDDVRALAQHPASLTVEHQAVNLLRKMNKAVRDDAMIEAGDRIAVGVSGGKDSLALLDLLVRRQRIAREKFELAAVHIESEVPCGGCLDPRQIGVLCEAYGVPFEAVSIRVTVGPDGESRPATCFGCSFGRRKALFETAHRMGCNRVALAHHQDDVAHTAMLNLFRHGRVEGLQPVRPLFGGVLVLIRPLWLIEERRLSQYARARGIPPQTSRCPNSAVSERATMRKALDMIEKDCRRARINMLRGLGIVERRRTHG
jgi:tRNA 2-thiocytidine biosynthesis protein TtcA